MTAEKIRYLLHEKGRYYYQRKVPKALLYYVGQTRWHIPVMAEPILEPRKTLYSLRGTFQDAMRRAGAPLEVRQAILGHTQGGAIKHYNSGPEFELMQEWVWKSDPRE